jgi:tRNA dimethylallyltransferase
MHTLIVLLGPTGVGKTAISLRLAEHLHCPIISCDSRQFYREMKIGTAAPTAGQLEKVPHYFVGNRSVTDGYNAGQFELDVINMLGDLFTKHHQVMMVGGSMLYIEAVCKGIDDLPTVDPEIRKHLHEMYTKEGLQGIRMQLKLLDPVYYEQVDLMNAQRILHALEICIMTDKPYSLLRTNSVKQRPFEIIKTGLTRPREELYGLINQRTDLMIHDGLEQEARSLYHLRTLNALNTVGYKEMFGYFDGKYTREEAIALIKQNSRRYAKKQLSWFNRDKAIQWFHPDDEQAVVAYIESQLHQEVP